MKMKQEYGKAQKKELEDVEILRRRRNENVTENVYEVVFGTFTN